MTQSRIAPEVEADSQLLSHTDTVAWLEKLQLDVRTCNYLVRVMESLQENVALQGYSCFWSAGVEIVERLAPLGVDRHCLAAGFLYPLVQAGALPPVDWGQDPVSDETRLLLQAVSRLEDIRERAGTGRSGSWRLKGQSQAENIRSMVLAMSGDLQVTLLWLAERATSLARAIEDGSDSCRPLARQVLRICAPIASRLGVHRLQSEMEDLCLAALAPRQMARISTMVRGLKTQWESAAEGVVQTLQTELDRAGIRSSVESRMKTLYGIWRKMRRKGVGLDSLHDVLGMRVILHSESDCYLALGCVHRLWAHLSDEFDDYIGTPKTNGYRSIHTAVVIPRIGTMEVQIRTAEMDREAEYGACAHWRYKGQGISNPWFENRVRKLRQLADQQTDGLESTALADILLEDSVRSHIYVFTRDGDAVELPQGATLLDFAYHVHSDLGHRCSGGLVNGVSSAPGRVLRNGQSVEVTVSDQASPQREWLTHGILNTVRARHMVQRWFRRLDADRAREIGEQLLLREISRQALPITALRELATMLKQSTVEEMQFQLGSDKLTLAEVRQAAAELASRPQSQDSEEES